MESDFLAARQFAEKAAQDIGNWLSQGFGVAPVSHAKSDHAADVVTTFDTEADDKLSTELSKFDSSLGFHGEESGKRGSTITFWLVDPIDGTGHYVRGTPFCTTMISLIHEGEVVVSVINDFLRNNLYSAHKGGGATCNGAPIKVSDRSMREAYVATEINLSINGNPDLMARVQQATTPMCAINCGWDFAMTASGNLDGRIMKDPFGSDWDYAPGGLLVTEAGGRVANIGKSTYNYQDHNFLAATPQVFSDLTEGPNAIFPIE